MNAIVFINIATNKAESSAIADGDIEESYQIWIGDHPSKLLVAPQMMDPEAAQELAQQVTDSLRWELWRVVDHRSVCDRLIVVPTALVFEERQVAAFYAAGDFGSCDKRESTHETYGDGIAACDRLLKAEIAARKQLHQLLPDTIF